MSLLESLLGKSNSLPESRNLALEQAMHHVATKDNPENRNVLYFEFLKAMLWVPVVEMPEGLKPGAQKTDSSINIEIPGTADREGKRVICAFTDAEALKNWDPNTPHLGIKAQELFRLVWNSTDLQAIIVNPFDPIRKMIRPGGKIARAELDLLSKGIIPKIGAHGIQYDLKPNEQVFIGRPASPPSGEVLSFLDAAAATIPEIAGLHLFQLATGKSSSTVIGIDLTTSINKEREAEIAHTLGRAIQSKLGPGAALDFVVLRGTMRAQVIKSGILAFHR